MQWRIVLSRHISGGHEHGVELTAGADLKPVTRPMCLNLEHYYARAMSGRFVPRQKAEITGERVANDAVQIKIAPFEQWRVEAAITYTLLPAGVIEARFELSFDADYPRFEAFISNYFHEPTEPHIRVGGSWAQPKLGEREHRYWPRSTQDAADVGDGRLDEFYQTMADYACPVDPQCYDLPVMVTPIADSDWSIIHVIEPEQCASLSANRTWHAHDFSLFGRDVSKGETHVARAWMAYRQLDNLDQALELYTELTRRPHGERACH